MRKRTWICALLLLVLGLGVILYPPVSAAVNRRNGSYAIGEWQTLLEGLEDSQLREQRDLAGAYNDALLSGGEPRDYASILEFGSGVMGYIRIPAIGVDLPVYHGVSEEVLSRGVGHLPQSSLPIGREGDHAVLTGHTGLPSARLFTDLTKLKEGDLFFVRVLEEELCYAVDEIRVVLPDEAQALSPVPGMDLCTLVTCTPYGVNSHRLLVRGSRTELPASPEEPSVPLPEEGDLSPLWLLLLLPPAGGILLLKRYLDGRKKPAYNGKYLRR